MIVNGHEFSERLATFSHFYFDCSQQWILDKQDLIKERQADLQVLSEEEYQKVMIFFTNCEQLLFPHVATNNWNCSPIS